MQTTDKNRRIVLNERPKGEPNDNTLRLEDASIPQPGDGEVLLRTVYLSLDPYMRGRMSAAKSYANPVEIGDTMVGGTVSRVVTSKNKRFNEGDWVLSQGGWQDYSITNGEGVINLGSDTPNPSWALGILGMPGFTAWAGLEFIGEPREGETVVVAAATGPVGATVGQIAKLKGCRVVGIAGGEEKCRYATEELGFDACIDRREGDLKEALKEACPDGIDVYFENVGGAVFDAVLPLMNPHGRIPVCGLVAQYNATSLPEGPDRSPLILGTILTQKLRVQGFIIFDTFGHKFPEFQKVMQAWLKDGKIKYREDMVEGLEKAPQALNGMLKGENFGKLVVRVGPDA
ncbi:NADP-dependent oxidoreductase [Nitratireductor basaltis]|uniref:Putative NADP-dependent oxidoreductase n=1 Tax=Nitratireductor basaltis TaxID=472175 RepID=A0A084UBT7_9HYPH|nr:NADP-dependent oxidoreductase [Nitratireductor basaltis]KFB10423.1 putative NADP-dependent oxidoreductase precursor [Nitratireductor basaltis]